MSIDADEQLFARLLQRLCREISAELHGGERMSRRAEEIGLESRQCEVNASDTAEHQRHLDDHFVLERVDGCGESGERGDERSVVDGEFGQCASRRVDGCAQSRLERIIIPRIGTRAEVHVREAHHGDHDTR